MLGSTDPADSSKMQKPGPTGRNGEPVTPATESKPPHIGLTDTRLTETMVTELGLPAELQGLELNSELAAERKRRRLRRLNTVTIPMLRFVGFSCLSSVIYLYLRFFVLHPAADRIALGYAAGSLLYCLISMLVLRTAPRRFVGGLSLLFLTLDVLLHVAAIYITGGEESWLAALLLLRVADQATSGQRRALFFAHFNAACFLVLIAFLAWGEDRNIEWAREGTKVVMLYGAGWWIAISARGGDLRRRRVSTAIDATRHMVRELQSQARHLDEAKARAELASTAKSQFLANMSHELRTPLGAVVGIAELLAKETMTASQREYVGLLQTSADSVLSLIDDILDFSKIEANKLTIQPEWVAIEAEIMAVIQLLEHRTRERRLKLGFDAPELPLVWLDPARFRQILFNLVGNAIKFTHEGSIEVRVTVPFRNEDGTRLRVEVVDSGIGISPTDQQHLFEPFTQADASLTRRYGGTGLGLAITQRLVELMGGAIGVNSRLGEGSTFWFELTCRDRGAQLPPS